MNEQRAHMERMEFIEMAMRPDTPDEIALQIDKPPLKDETTDGLRYTTFSEEALDALAEQFRTFLMARVLGQMEKTGAPPQHVRATVTLDWAPGHPFEDAGPFYHIEKDEGITPIDHTRRKWKAW